MGILIPSVVNSCRIGFSHESRQMVQTRPSAMMAGWLMRFRPKLIVGCCGLSTCPAKDPNALAAWERDPSAPSCGPSPLWVISDVLPAHVRHVRFSNRPFRVKHFQTIRRCSVDVAHGLALLFGIGAKALPLWDSRMRWSNLCSGLAVRRNGRSKRTCELTSSIVPRGTSSTARWSSSFLLLDLIL